MGASGPTKDQTHLRIRRRGGCPHPPVSSRVPFLGGPASVRPLQKGKRASGYAVRAANSRPSCSAAQLEPHRSKGAPKREMPSPRTLILYRPPKAAPNSKPNGVGLRWRRRARKRAQFSPSGGNGDKRTLRRRSERRGAVCRLSHPRLCDDCQGRLIGGPPAITPAVPTEPAKLQAESHV